MSTKHASYQDMEKDVNRVLKMDTNTATTDQKSFNIMDYSKNWKAKIIYLEKYIGMIVCNSVALL